MIYSSNDMLGGSTRVDRLLLIHRHYRKNPCTRHKAKSYIEDKYAKQSQFGRSLPTDKLDLAEVLSLKAAPEGGRLWTTYPAGGEYVVLHIGHVAKVSFRSR